MDKDRVMRALEHCSTSIDCTECEYEADCYGGERLPGVPLIRDALELIRGLEQQARQMRIDDYWRKNE